MKVGIVAKRTEVSLLLLSFLLAQNFTTSACPEGSNCFSSTILTSFQELFSIGNFRFLLLAPVFQAEKPYIAWIYTHTLALHHHSSGYSFTAAKARTASLGRNQNFVRSSCVLRQQQASWRFSLRSSRPKIFSVRTTAVRFTVVHYFLFPIQCILVFY